MHGFKSTIGKNITLDFPLCSPVETCCMNADQLCREKLSLLDIQIKSSLLARLKLTGGFNCLSSLITTKHKLLFPGLVYSCMGRPSERTLALALTRDKRFIAACRSTILFLPVKLVTAISPIPWNYPLPSMLATLWSTLSPTHCVKWLVILSQTVRH